MDICPGSSCGEIIKIHSEGLPASQLGCRKGQDAGSGAEIEHGLDLFPGADEINGLKTVLVVGWVPLPKTTPGSRMIVLHIRFRCGLDPGRSQEKLPDPDGFNFPALPLFIGHLIGVEKMQGRIGPDDILYNSRTGSRKKRKENPSSSQLPRKISEGNLC